jgi:hypothetical protein
MVAQFQDGPANVGMRELPGSGHQRIAHARSFRGGTGG